MVHHYGRYVVPYKDVKNKTRRLLFKKELESNFDCIESRVVEVTKPYPLYAKCCEFDPRSETGFFRACDLNVCKNQINSRIPYYGTRLKIRIK